MQEEFTLKRKFRQVGAFKIWLSVCSIVINHTENQKLGCSALQKEQHKEHVLLCVTVLNFFFFMFFTNFKVNGLKIKDKWYSNTDYKNNSGRLSLAIRS